VTQPIQVPTIGEPELSPETVTERALEEIIQGSRVIHARHQGFAKAIARKLLAVMAERDALKAEFDDCVKHLIFLQPAQSVDEWGEPIWRCVKPRMDALKAELATARQTIERLSAPVTDAARKAALEICNTYEVTAPRGKSFANRPPVTIAIIIEQALIAARKDAK
jgi:hypothetical protein